MATHSENENFILNTFDPCALDKAIDYIKRNICVENVYDRHELEEWALENGYEKVGE